jgi:hypothetical protein|tara:strand:+ start:38 stop:526 length:489 start_codon:yes stop_codon:yes gene_type:complete
MKELKSINIKGKQYVEVNERLRYFRENFKDWSLESEVVEKTNTSITIKAIIKDAEGRTRATGLAEEVKGSTFINKTSYVENCETSAWGRALGNLGIGIETSVASYEEVANAIKQQDQKTKKTLTKQRFESALKAVQEGTYTKQQLVSQYELTELQTKALELC